MTNEYLILYNNRYGTHKICCTKDGLKYSLYLELNVRDIGKIVMTTHYVNIYQNIEALVKIQNFPDSKVLLYTDGDRWYSPEYNESIEVSDKWKEKNILGYDIKYKTYIKC